MSLRVFCVLRNDKRSLLLWAVGYHVCKDIWDPPVGKIVVCQREGRNQRDHYAVPSLLAMFPV